jgi:hypothetical protein
VAEAPSQAWADVSHRFEANMKKFMAIYMAPAAEFERMMRSSTPEQQRKGMEAWMKWMTDFENRESIA